VRKTANLCGVSLLLIAALLLSAISTISVKPASANPGKLTWSIVDTPSPDNNIIVSPSEVNIIAIGSDDSTFYAVDIPNASVYKSTNGGVWWQTELISDYLALAGAGLPVWNLAVAPDDVNFLVAVTDDYETPPAPPVTNGPLMVFVSEDGGANWQNTNLTVVPPEYISCVDISMTYGANNRDIAVGTRTGAGTGTIWVLNTEVVTPTWVNQSLPPSMGWTGGDVVAVKFSPTYSADDTLVVIYSDGTGTFLNAGQRDVGANFTDWSAIYATPIEITTVGPGSSPDDLEIITADLELPSDFSGSNPSLRRFYVSTDATAAGVQFGVYRVDNDMVYYIKPPTTVPTNGRISSIAYFGTYAGGRLLAGEVEAAPPTGMVYIWRTSDPISNTPVWYKSDDYKSPTGGATATLPPVGNFANAQLAWSPDGARAYCGTSSANLSLGSTGWGVAGRWPYGYTVAGSGSVALDESAFSVSPYAPDYGQLLDLYSKSEDDDIGNIWNQLSLIDTGLIDTGAATRFLSDVAALEAPEVAAGATPEDYSILYLASINQDVGGFDSIWRSTSDPLGRTWERVLCLASTNDDIILRVKQTPYDEAGRSDVIVFADRGANVVSYSEDEGQVWEVRPLTTVTDLALASDELIYILNDIFVYRYIRQDFGWIQTNKESIQIGSGHTIAVPLKNPENEEGEIEDWVIVGGQGPPLGTGSVAWADFSEIPVSFETPLDRWLAVPVVGDVQAITDDMFEQNKTIYAASHDATNTSGKIYRWVIDESTEWEELEPPNTAFYGLAMRNAVLYGAWRTAEIPEIINYTAGVDRTLFSRDKVPPPPEWDYLTTGLPAPPGGVLFTREPSSLKISSNEYNNLWAIDNNPYDWLNKIGCLWAYTDTVAKVGPWTTSPASGDYIPVDPVTGRANEINFRWRQLSYSSVYELQLAKDSDFSIRVLVNEEIIPVDQLSPGCYFPAGGLVLAPASASGIASLGNIEAGHTYYWRVRSRAATTGEIIRSPWSATMYFTVEAGLPVMAEYPAITLLGPPYGARGVPLSPCFSWSPIPKATKYEFILARDAALQQVIVKTNVPMTSYKYDGRLDYNSSYFWQVRAIEPVFSDPSLVGSFTVVAMGTPAAKEKPLPLPLWAWGLIVVCVILLAVMIVLAMVR